MLSSVASILAVVGLVLPGFLVAYVVVVLLATPTVCGLAPERDGARPPERSS